MGKTRSRYGAKSFEVGENGQALTLGAIFDAAMVHKSNSYVRISAGYGELKDATLNDIITKIGETSRKPANCDPSRFYMRLNGIVLPTEEEWASVTSV